MIERVKTKNKVKIANFYNNIYMGGGYHSPSQFYSKMLKILDLTNDTKKKLLDIACGQGVFLSVAENFVKTYGVDISENAIEMAKKAAKKTEFKISSADDLPYKNKVFDYVTCLGSLEHFPEIKKALKEIRRVMKPDGKAVIHVPNSKYLIHKLLGIDTQGQINERLATEIEWGKIIEQYLKIEKCYKYNTHWYFGWIPKGLCCHFTFLCKK